MSNAAKKEESKLTPVTFIKAHSRYVRGDIAGFSKEKAQQLIDRKIAVAGTELPTAKEG